MNITRLFSPSYIFDPLPGPFMSGLGKYLMIFFAIIVVAGVVAYIISTHKQKSPLVRKMFSKVSNFLLSIGIVALLLVFFREQRASILSMPVLLYLWFIGAVVWLVFLYNFFFKKIPQKKNQIKEKQEKDKYLP